MILYKFEIAADIAKKSNNNKMIKFKEFSDNTTKKRMLGAGIASLASMPFHIVFIFLSIKHEITGLIVFWSIWLGVAIAASVISFLKVFRDQS